MTCFLQDRRFQANWELSNNHGEPKQPRWAKKWCFTKKKLSPGRIHLGFNQGQWLQISSTILGICFQLQHGRRVKLDQKEETSVKFHGSLGFAGPIRKLPWYFKFRPIFGIRIKILALKYPMIFPIYLAESSLCPNISYCDICVFSTRIFRCRWPVLHPINP